MFGMDLSNYQRKIDLSLATDKYDFCIVKASEGIGFEDKSFKNYVVKLTELGKLIGCYHFARPDLHGTRKGMIEEADWFISLINRENLIGMAILVLDWETEPMDREDLITAFVGRIKEITGVQTVIYGSNSKLKKWKDWDVIKYSPIWIAQWPSTRKIPVGEPISYNPPAGNYSIWQYSATGVYPNYNGTIDLDFSTLDKSTWELLAKSESIDKENIIPQMQWAIDNGLFVGGGNGMYYPREYLTREQLAIVLNRFYKKFIKGE